MGGGNPIEDIGDAIGDAFSSVGDAVGDVFGGVEDVLNSVGDTISDAGSWIDDNVIQPALQDPVSTVSKIAAIATGNPQLIPYIDAASVAAKGGDIEDIGKAYIVSEIGQGAGNEVGSRVFQETGSKIAASAASGATRGAISGGAAGRDPLSAALVGGATGATGQAVRLGSEELFGPAATQTGLEKAATSFVGDVARTAVGQEVAKNVYEPPRMSARPAYGQTSTASQEPFSYKTASTDTEAPAQTPFTLSTSDFEIKRYINDNGEVVFIQFRGGLPQQPIPAGFREEKLGGKTVSNPYSATIIAKSGGLATKKQNKKPSTSKGLAVKKK